jgi:hypothetical protein
VNENKNTCLTLVCYQTEILRLPIAELRKHQKSQASVTVLWKKLAKFEVSSRNILDVIPKYMQV